MRKTLLLLCLCVLNAYTCDYRNGVHLVNEDSVSYSFIYSVGTLSSRICWINKPTESIKKGIVPLEFRSQNGLTPVESETASSNEPPQFNTPMKKMRGEIEPHSEICCLSATDRSITIEGVGKVTLKSGSTLLFKKGKLWILLKDGSLSSAQIKTK